MGSRLGLSWVRDAINFMRRLEFRFLWADSLCIIQDDADDWKWESVKMADIYKGVTLTLVAAAARSDSNRMYATQANTSP
jgi:hypothetical protein